MGPEDLRDDFNAIGPVRGVLLASLRIDSLQAIRAGRQQSETDVFAGILQLAEALGLAFLLAALRHRDIDQIHSCFPQYAHGQPADDRFVVGVRREK